MNDKAVLEETETIFKNLKINIMVNKKVIFAIAFPFLTLGMATILLAMSPDNNNPESATINIEEPQPEELGKVNWLRSYDKAIAQSDKNGKPVLILFQEVPGCSTCRNYGNNALSHPLIVEAIESLFVPLAIHNNKKGEDAKVLQSFGEPSWNNPVVRVINADRRELTPRLGGDYSSLGLVNAMINSLTINGSKIPQYLALLQEELQAKKAGVETATFGMYCFWTGEKELGSLDGVVSTQPGFMGGREVVTVEFNPEVVAFEDILTTAQSSHCADYVYAENEEQKMAAKKLVSDHKVTSTSKFRLDKEPKYYLSKTHYQYVPMTDLQATKANALIGKRQLPDAVLSPKQVEFASFIAKNKGKAWKSAINVPFEKAWETAMAVK